MGLLALAGTLALSSSAPPVAHAQVAGGPTTPLLDDFERPDENPLWQWGNWADTGIAGGVPLPLVSGTARSGNAASAYRTELVAGDMEAWATFTGAPDGLGQTGIIVCLQDAGTAGWDGYRFRMLRGFFNLEYRVERVVNGVATTLWGSQEELTGPGERLLLRRVGDTLEAWQLPAGSSTWQLRFQTLEQSFHGGRIGIQVQAGTAGASFGIAEVGGTGSTSEPPLEPPLPATPVRDDFNRPNENPLSQGGQWAPSGIASGLPLPLVSNAVVDGNSDTAYRPGSLNGDVEVYATLVQPPDPLGNATVFLHLSDVGTPSWDGYGLAIQRGFTQIQYRLKKVVDGVEANIGGWDASYSGSGEKLLLRRLGSWLQAWQLPAGQSGWILRQQVRDTAFDGGSIGLRNHSGNNQPFAVDDFGGGTIGETPPPPGGGAPGGNTFGTGVDGSGTHGRSGTSLFADPVNSLTGTFTTTVDDLELPGTGVSFSWVRSYTSADPTVGRLGPGWTDSYSASLQIQPNGDVLLHGEDGQQLLYTLQGDGSFAGAPGARSRLSAVAGGYELMRQDQVVYRFDSQGRLLSMKDRNERGVTLAYDGSGRLLTVTDAAGRQASVSYNAQNLVSQVQSADGRSVSYGYTSGRLTSVTDARGKQWTYTYDASGRLTSIRDPLNHAQVTNVYAANGRVQSQTDAVGKTTTFAWDATNEIATATDANGKAWRHDYDQGVLAKEIDPLNNVTQLGHDADLNTSAVTSPTAQQTTMTYDAAGNLTSATAPASLGSVQKTFVYNARNDPTQITDARGTVTSYTYTPAGNVAAVTQDGIQVASYTYDSAGRVLTSTDGRGKTTTYTYDANGNLASVADPLGNTTTYTYDAAGRVATRVDPKGNCAGCTPAEYRWSYTYDAAGNQLTETDPLGNTTTNVYDDAGRLVQTTDAMGRTTSYAYDDANRLLSETGPDPDGAGPQTAPVTSYTYDPVGNKVSETDPRGSTTSFAYDAANRLVSETGPDPDGAGPQVAPVTTYAYDGNGNLASSVEPRGNVQGANPADYRTSYSYDAAGRLLTSTDPLGNVTVNTYDPVGNLASVRDANGRTTSYGYDAAGRILTVTAPDGGVTTYTYDGAGNVLTRTDANAHTTTFAYDDAGRLVSEQSPDPDGPGPQGPALTTYAYDRNGNRITLTDPNGNATPTPGDGVTSYGYDRLNRLTSIDYADSTPDVTFTYDAVGNRLTMADASGTETRSYDSLDRLLTVTRGQDTFAYAYDPAGNVTRRTYPGGVVSDYAYDPLNRLTTVTSGGQTTSYAYDAASNLVTTTLPAGNGYVESRVYDRAGRLTEVASMKGASTLSRFQISLDAVGNPLQIVRSGSLAQTQTYAYDLNDRLTQVCFQAGSCPGASDPFIRWTYDLVGNRLTEQRPGASTVNYSYDARDRLLQAGSTSYTYDQNGNQLSAGSRTFAYDLANRLKQTTLGSTTTTYTYDGDGVRLQASTGTQAAKKTSFLWDVSFGLPQLALERDGNTNPIRRYLYGVRRISQTAGNQTSYFHRDGLDSSANLTSSSGATQWTWSYEPFGSLRTETKASGNQPDVFMKFTGEYADPTGLYHLRARQYDPAGGRFLTRDPAAQTVNEAAISAYAYVANRPTVMVDPSGKILRPSSVALAAARQTASSVPWDVAPASVAIIVPGRFGPRCTVSRWIKRDRGDVLAEIDADCNFRIWSYRVGFNFWTETYGNWVVSDTNLARVKRSIRYDYRFANDFQPVGRGIFTVTLFYIQPLNRNYLFPPQSWPPMICFIRSEGAPLVCTP